MRRTTPTVGLVVLTIVLWAPVVAAGSQEVCEFDLAEGRIVCEESGGTDSGGNAPAPNPQVGKRYVHLTTRPGVGDCYYWSNTTGGLDAWDSANDPAIINIVLRTPECPVNAAPLVDAEETAWTIFRSWPLAAPQVSLQPAGVGITGLPTYLATPAPGSISHIELLPDGRTLRVRAHIEHLDVSWGDSSLVRYQPSGALPFPIGVVTHTYLLKTCTNEYRNNHPSGGLCHPTLDRYQITATFSWFAEFTTDGTWNELGILTRTTPANYPVEEARGVSVP